MMIFIWDNIYRIWIFVWIWLYHRIVLKRKRSCSYSWTNISNCTRRSCIIWWCSSIIQYYYYRTGYIICWLCWSQPLYAPIYPSPCSQSIRYQIANMFDDSLDCTQCISDWQSVWWSTNVSAPQTTSNLK